jgi:hypothetical protein
MSFCSNNITFTKGDDNSSLATKLALSRLTEHVVMPAAGASLLTLT